MKEDGQILSDTEQNMADTDISQNREYIARFRLFPTESKMKWLNQHILADAPFVALEKQILKEMLCSIIATLRYRKGI